MCRIGKDQVWYIFCVLKRPHFASVWAGLFLKSLNRNWRRERVKQKDRTRRTPDLLGLSSLCLTSGVSKSSVSLSAVSARPCEELQKRSSVWIKEWEISERSYSNTLRPYLETTKLWRTLAQFFSAIKTLQSLEDLYSVTVRKLWAAVMALLSIKALAVFRNDLHATV